MSHAHYGQESTTVTLLPCPVFLFPNRTTHVGIDRPQTASTNGRPQRPAGPTILRLKYNPATPHAGAKGFRTQLTLLQLRDSGRRGWPDGSQRVTAEEEGRSIAPWPHSVDEECRTRVTTEMLGNVNFKLKVADGTHLEHRSKTKTRQQRAYHFHPAPRSSSPT